MKLGHTIEYSRAQHPELTDKILDELRVWSEEHRVTGIPDVQLAMFAHSCYYDVQAAKRCMSVYYRLRSSVPEFFDNRDPTSDSIQQAMKIHEFVTLPLPDANGNRIIFYRLADTRPSIYVLNDAIKLFLMSMDASLYEEGCPSGYVLLFDMRGARLGHLMRLSLGSIRRILEYVQDGLPVRLKAIYVINAVWFLDKVLALIKPFMRPEFFEIMHFYTGDASEIHEHIPPKCLPKDYSGELESSSTELHEENCKKMRQLKDYFLEEQILSRGWSSSPSDKDICASQESSTTNGGNT